LAPGLGIQEKLPLFREGDGESGQVDDQIVRFDLGEIRMDREIQLDGRVNEIIEIQPQAAHCLSRHPSLLFRPAQGIGPEREDPHPGMERSS